MSKDEVSSPKKTLADLESSPKKTLETAKKTLADLETDQTLADFLKGSLTNIGLTFKVWEYSKPQLLGICQGCFLKLDCLNKIHKRKLLNFIKNIADGYFDNPYHSFLHAVDVLYMMFYFLYDLKVAQTIGLNKFEIAALTHDVLHPGLNNLFQINARTELTLLYNDQSVLENHSCTHLKFLLQKHQFLELMDYESFLDDINSQNLSSTTANKNNNNSSNTRKHIRRNSSSLENNTSNDDSNDNIKLETKSDIINYMTSLMIDSIMNTDMCFHFKLMDQLNEFELKIEERKRKESCLTNKPIIESPISPESKPINFNIPSRSSSRVSAPPRSSSLKSEIDPSSSSTPPPPSKKPIPIRNNSMKSNHTHPHKSEDTKKNNNHNPPPSNNLPKNNDNIVEDSTSIKSKMVSNIKNACCGLSLPLSIPDKRKMINILLHAADISNAARPFEVCKKWSDMIVEEFFLQGEQEVRLNLPISPSMDRMTTNQIQISIQFNDFIVRPFFEGLNSVLRIDDDGGVVGEQNPTFDRFVDILNANRDEWVSIKGAPESDIETDDEEEEEDKASITEEDIIESPTNLHPPSPLTISPTTTNVFKTLLRNSLPIESGFHRKAVSSTDALSAHRMGRRLSTAAGTIDIPGKNVMAHRSSLGRFKRHSYTAESGGGGRSSSLVMVGGRVEVPTGVRNTYQPGAYRSVGERKMKVVDDDGGGVGSGEKRR